jgi:PAS domain S-box-containing protein
MDGRGVATYEDGRPTFLYGIGMDVSERIDAEAAVRASEERFRLAARVAGFGLFEYDFEAGSLYRSDELEAMFGSPGPAPDGSLDWGPVHPDDRDELLRNVAASQDPEGDGALAHEYRIVRPDGTVGWVAANARTLFTAPDGSPHRQPVRMVGIVHDVTERRQADDIRDVFIGMLSHELRTPVTAIYGGSQLLRRPHLSDEVRRDIVDGIVGESERLERLVENLLVLAQAERHVVEGGRDPVLLRPIIGRIIEDKQRRWPNATFEVEVEPGLPPAMWDDGSSELVIRNLISNALKYGGTESVRVTARSDGDEIAIDVADDGPGIPEGEADRVFELFYRSDDARRRAQGAGIGLFVVRALVESAGGSVRASNRPEGGAVFGVRLPRFVEPDDILVAD